MKCHSLFPVIRALAAALLPFAHLGIAAQSTPAARPALMVLADPADPYRSLADAIAKAERCPVATTWSEIGAADPEHILWIASPRFLGESTLVAAGRFLSEREPLLSVGIISGSTESSARALWLRGGIRPAANPVRIVAPLRIEELGTHRQCRTAYTSAAVAAALTRADHVFYSGHGSPQSWVHFAPDNLPQLPPLVVTTASCRNFQPSARGNIALEFCEQGAAAFAGFVSSPSGNYLVGESGEVPSRHTWPGFPLGALVQVENRAARRAFANFHQYFLLGDPRIAARATPPYRIVRDERTETERTLELADLPPGCVPIAIADGASYDDIEIRGLGRWMNRQLFFNARIQAADRGDTKYLLVDQPGGTVELRLRRRSGAAALGWRNITDLADTRYIGNGSDRKLVGAAAIVGLLWAGWLVWSRRATPLVIGIVGLVGVTVAAGLSLVDTWHLGSVTVTPYPVAPNLFDTTARALLVACASLAFISSRGRFGRLLALLLVTFPAWIVPGILLPIAAVLRYVVRTREIVYDHWLMSCAGGLRMLLAAAFYAAIFALVRRGLKVEPRPRVTK